MATASATRAVAVADGALGPAAAALSRSEGRRVLLQLVRKPMVVLGALVILAWVDLPGRRPALPYQRQALEYWSLRFRT